MLLMWEVKSKDCGQVKFVDGCEDCETEPAKSQTWPLLGQFNYLGNIESILLFGATSWHLCIYILFAKMYFYTYKHYICTYLHMEGWMCWWWIMPKDTREQCLNHQPFGHITLTTNLPMSHCAFSGFRFSSDCAKHFQIVFDFITQYKKSWTIHNWICV